ncbi:MAG: M56 family metallopeptidase [Bacteroidales bacterium]|nr:M56 family metallopeptidase [Bacteroidales bacterium]
MTAFLLYIARSGLYLAVFYAFYLLVMRHTTFFRFNRIALLAGSVLCAVLPLLKVRTVSVLAEAGPLTMTAVEEGTISTSPEASFPWTLLICCIYNAGIAAVLVTTLLSAMKIIQMEKTGQKIYKDGFRTVILKDGQPSFTFGKTIFIGGKDLNENPAIFSHETMHVKSRHYLDLFLFRAIQIFWWWNPLVWIARTELGLLHEYEADEKVIQKGIDATQYQLLLVRKAVGEQRFSLASGFQHAQLKNRITMMIKSSSKSWMRLAYLALIPLLAALVYACNPSKNAKVETSEETVVAETIPFQEVEVKPTFNDGDDSQFISWIHKNIEYPESAIAAEAQGRMLVQFSIMPDGSMDEFEVVRGINPDLDAEVLRVMKSCDLKWTPGMQNGKPIKVSYTLPIVFRLQ